MSQHNLNPCLRKRTQSKWLCFENNLGWVYYMVCFQAKTRWVTKYVHTWGNLPSSLGHWLTPFSRASKIWSPATKGNFKAYLIQMTSKKKAYWARHNSLINPKSRPTLISLNIITVSRERVKRIRKIITKGKMRWSLKKFPPPTA